MVRVAVTTIAAFVQLSLLAQHSFGLPIQWVFFCPSEGLRHHVHHCCQICGYAGALKRWNRKALHSTVRRNFLLVDS